MKTKLIFLAAITILCIVLAGCTNPLEKSLFESVEEEESQPGAGTREIYKVLSCEGKLWKLSVTPYGADYWKLIDSYKNYTTIGCPHGYLKHVSSNRTQIFTYGGTTYKAWKKCYSYTCVP
jgi:hypothetical protein